jgi:hypothetical protein
MRPNVDDVRVRVPTVATGLAAVLTLAGCTHNKPATAGVAQPTATVPASAVAPCPGPQITARSSESEGLMAGRSILRISLTNTGSGPCRLDEAPVVVPLGANGSVLPHTFDSELDGDFGEPVGATLAPAASDAAYIPITITGREADLNPCTGQVVRIFGWRVSFSSWSHSIDVRAVGEIGSCRGRYRSGGVTASSPVRGRLTDPALPPSTP